AERLARQEVLKRTVLSSWDRLIDYLRVSMAHLPTESFRILFLDVKNALIADEVQQTGTVNHTAVYPREVVKRALELGATSIILVHNHPSGDPPPSPADTDMTLEMVKPPAAPNIPAHDHLIVGHSEVLSFKSRGLI